MANQAPDFEGMTDAEVAEWQYEHRNVLDDDLEDAEEVEFEVVKPLGTAISFRLSEDEATKIREAASRAETSLSEWVRQACMQQVALQSVTERPTPQDHGIDITFPGGVVQAKHLPAMPGSLFKGALRDLHSNLAAMHKVADLLRKTEEDLDTATARTTGLIEAWLAEIDTANTGGEAGSR